MAVTISTHNGARVARSHNLRIRETVAHEKHIDPRGHHETWADIPLAKAYDILFGDAVKEYNEHQKRQDRQIRSYLQTVKQDAKKHPVYEMIVSIGSVKRPVDQDLGREIMLEFTKGWKERNPNLKMIGAYYHADEKGVPHVHIDYVPVAHGYKRGMRVQTGLVKALGEQGIYKQGRDTAQILWERRENQKLESICREHGIDVIHPQAGKDIQHVEKKEYIAKQDIELYREAIAYLEKATEKIHQASYTLEEGELPDWIERKGILRHTYTVQEDHLDRIHELLAADTLRDALRDVQSAYECTYDRLLESEREALTREKGALEAKVKALEHECRDLEQERSMMLQKVRTQDRKIERLETFIEEHNLSHAYEREREWGHQDLIREWEVER